MEALQDACREVFLRVAFEGAEHDLPGHALVRVRRRDQLVPEFDPAPNFVNRVLAAGIHAVGVVI